MRVGDLVRFKQSKEYIDWKIGLLLEYTPWMKVATILYKGKIFRIRAQDTQIHKRAKRN